MNPFLAVLLGLFFLAYVAIGAVAVRRPLLRRLAIREATLRPGQTAVFALGLLIAAAALFSIQVIFDTMYETNRVQALQTWTRDDIEISGGGGYFEPGLGQRLAARTQACSCIAAYQDAIVTHGSVVDLDRADGRSNVQVTGLDLASQQPFGEFVLAGGRSTVGAELEGGGVFLTEPLAAALGTQTGDRLQVIAGSSSSREVTVAGVVRREGVGAYGLGLGMFGSLQTVQQLAGASGVNVIRVTARGDGDAEIANAQAAAPVLRTALAADGSHLQVLEVKRGALDIVVKMSQNGRPFVTSFGVIIALAATALVANLAIMLAEERRPRMAVLRAMGLTRTGLVRLSVTEGAIYSLLGAVAGLPAGLLIAFGLYHLESGPPGTVGPQGLVFSMHFDSLLGAVAAAALINLVVVFLASLRTSRMAISSAIRDLPEPSAGGRQSRKRLAFLGVLGLAGLAVMVSGHSDFALLGGALIIAVAAGFLKGRVADRWRYSAAGVAAAAWASIDFSLIGTASNPGPFAFAVIVLVLALSVLTATNLSLLDGLMGLVGHLSANLRATLRPAVAYSSRRPLRAGLVIAAFAIVMAMLTLINSLLLGQLYSDGYRSTVSGGWAVQAVVAGTQELSVPDSLRAEVGKSEELPSRTFFGPVNWVYSGFQGTTGWHQEPVTIFGLTTQQLTDGIGFGNSAAWASIASNPGLIAASTQVGSVLELATDHGTVSFRVAAQIPPTNGQGGSIIIPGIIASRAALDQLSGSAPGAMLLATPAPGVTASALARDLQRAFLSQGADVSTTGSLLDQDAAASMGLASFLIMLLRVGLLVGISSLGAVALRAVIERRRSIGMLRAIGFQPGQVLIGLLVEIAVVATAGLAVGLAVAYSIGGKEAHLLTPGGQFMVDPAGLAVTIGLVYAAVLLVTFLPALRASRLRPAAALRTVG